MQVDGQVVRVETSGAWVRVIRMQGCGRCHEPGGCSSQAESGHAECGEFLIDNPGAVTAGDVVTVTLPDGSAWRAALLAYGLPLALALAGAGFGYGLWRSDTAVAGGALLGLGTAFSCLYLVRTKGWLKGFRPRIAGDSTC